MAGRFTARLPRQERKDRTFTDILSALQVAGGLVKIGSDIQERRADRALTVKEQDIQGSLAAAETVKAEAATTRAGAAQLTAETGVEAQALETRKFEGETTRAQKIAQTPIKFGDFVRKRIAAKGADDVYGIPVSKALEPMWNRHEALVQKGADAETLYTDTLINYDNYMKPLKEMITKDLERNRDNPDYKTINPASGRSTEQLLSDTLTAVNTKQFAAFMFPAAAVHKQQIMEAQKNQMILKAAGRAPTDLKWYQSETDPKDIINLPKGEAPPDGYRPYSKPKEIETDAEIIRKTKVKAKATREAGEEARDEKALDQQRKDIAAMIKSSESAQLGVGQFIPDENRQEIANDRMGQAMNMTVQFLKDGGDINKLNIPTKELMDTIGVEKLARFMYNSPDQVKADVQAGNITREQAKKIISELWPEQFKQ